MSSDAELHATYKVANAPLKLFPYPHFYVEGVFPDDFYATLQKMLPEPDDMLPIGEVRAVRGYDKRFVLELGSNQLDALPKEKQIFWQELCRWLIAGRFSGVVTSKFAQHLRKRFGGQPAELYDEALLVQDTTDYSLGPHTDAARKVITMLFYLPRDESQRHLGTSLYVPKDPAFSSYDGPHFPRDRFDRVWTMPFVPNALFAFVKTDQSFHGVEPIADADCRRWLLLYDIYVRKDQTAAPQSAPAPAKKTIFSF
jgi:hypothetical protein